MPDHRILERVTNLEEITAEYESDVRNSEPKRNYPLSAVYKVAPPIPLGKKAVSALVHSTGRSAAFELLAETTGNDDPTEDVSYFNLTVARRNIPRDHPSYDDARILPEYAGQIEETVHHRLENLLEVINAGDTAALAALVQYV